MKDLMKLANECMEELDAIDVPYVKPIEWKIVDRATQWGSCTRKTQNGGYVFIISICRRLLDDELNDKPCKDTIFHELCHTIPNAWDDSHRGLWLKYAELINDCYGYDIKRASSVNQYNQVVQQKPRKTYKCKCTECHAVYEYHLYRAPKWYNRLDDHFIGRDGKVKFRYQCPHCHGHLKVVV